MTDETETQETAGKESIPADDQRFEVKWRKKNEPSQPPQPLPDAQPGTDTVETLSRRLAEEEQRVKDLQSYTAVTGRSRQSAYSGCQNRETETGPGVARRGHQRRTG